MPTIIGKIEAPVGHCDGCLEPLDGFSKALGYQVCFQCVKARHRALMNKKCSCGRHRRIAIVDYGHRTVQKCSRCLGFVRQI
jgi:hypothetical protein